jgi:hypothetical protein
MKSRQEIKKQAKELIAENDLWITMGLPYLLISAIDTLSYFGNRESGLSSALAILQIVYQLCASLYLFDIVTGRKAKSKTIKEQFSNIFRGLTAQSFKASLLVTLLTCLWFFLPYAIGLGLIISSVVTGEVGGLFVLGFGLVVASITIAIVKSYSYSLTIYLAKEHEDKKLFELVKESVNRMKGYKSKLFVFNLSFIGWGIGIALTGGLLGFYALPYMLAANTIFATEVMTANQPTNNSEKELEVF